MTGLSTQWILLQDIDLVLEQQPRKKRVWEVYTREGPVAAAAETMGAATRTFGLHNGCDLTRRAE